MKIDFHTHPILMKEYVEQDEDLLRACRDVYNIQNNLQPMETFHLQMDAAGIDKAVLLPIDCKRTQGVSIFSNEQIAEICSRSDRFIGFASVDPLDPQAPDRLEAAVTTLDLRGLKLAPEIQYFYPNDESHAFPVYERAQALQIPVLIHAGLSWEPEARIKYSRPEPIEDIAFKFPELKIVIAHMGWPWVREAAILATKHRNVYLDTSCLCFDNPTAFFDHLFSTQLPKIVLENDLRDKIVFGSNYPRIEIHKMVEAFEQFALTERCLQKILGENARTLLGEVKL